MITTALLRSVMPRLSEARAELFVGPLNETFARFDISTPLRAAMFLAQAAHESGELYRLVEILSYSATRLRVVWPHRFPTEEAAAAYERNPVELGNLVYANRLGNGSTESGDGFRYRGRGIFQLTGKANYQAAGEALGLPLVERPEWAGEPPGACLTAGWFWWKHNLNGGADQGLLKDVTRVINGGLNGLPERQRYYEAAIKVLSGR